MRHHCLEFFLIGACAVSALANVTVHLQSPMRDDPLYASYVPHIIGTAGGGIKVGVGSDSPTLMKSEGKNWYSFTWKSLDDYETGATFSFVFCPADAKDNTGCVEWEEGTNFEVLDFFGGDDNAWLYTDSKTGAFEKSFVAPGAKVVWFKSPWGNKALPQMIFGKDTVLMHFDASDTTKCGWFYGSLTTSMLSSHILKTAYFERNKAPTFVVPKAKNQVVEMMDALTASDTIYVDGTLDVPTVGAKIGKVGECFDPTRTLHVYNPWRTNSTYRDSSVYLTIDGIVDSVKMAADAGVQYWWHLDFSDSLVQSEAWNSASAKIQITRNINESPMYHYFDEKSRPAAKDLFPPGVYETWFFASTSLGSFDLSFSPLETKVVRLLTPWDNISPSMMVIANDDTVKMRSLSNGANKDTCGWFEAVYYKPTKDWRVLFKQSFGLELYGGNGIIYEGKPMDTYISLDSIMGVRDTAWLYPYPLANSAPAITDKFPNRLGLCPTMKISALVMDWAAESFPDSIDVDFGGVLDNCSGLVTGMVRDTLVNGLPARADSSKFPWAKCTAVKELDKWFIPQTVAVGADGMQYSNAVCRDIDLALDDEGFWMADYTNEADCNDLNKPGFFPLDDLEYLDKEKTVKNPKFDHDIEGWVNIDGGKTVVCKHNYGYSMKVAAKFKYVKGQYFEFRGDDDVWVYINNHLVVDIGGVHEPVEGAVNLDTIGQNNSKLKLVEGREYPFNIFYAERNATGSNFKMRTSINLQKQKTYYPVRDEKVKKTINYTLYQLQVDEAISCDISKDTKVDTILAPSIFMLSGGKLAASGVQLETGLNYGGITIKDDSAGFVIDTNEIVRARALVPGTYCLQFFLAADMALSSEVYFTVPQYPLPEIAFVDVFSSFGSDSITKLDPKGINLVGQPMTGGKSDTLLTNVIYPDLIPLEVAVFYMGNICTDCFSLLDLKSNDPITFYDQNKMPTNTLETDEFGVAHFFVKGDAPVNDASFYVTGSGVANSLVWDKIHFQDPPIPVAKTGSVYDRNGDGVPDSIYIPFSKKLEDIPDTISWKFGSDEWHTISNTSNIDIKNMVQHDSIVVITDDSLLNFVFTGQPKEIYTGSFRCHFTYLDKASGSLTEYALEPTPLEDRIGQILVDKPILKLISENSNKVTINISEGSMAGLLKDKRFIELKDKSGAVVDPSKYEVIDFNPTENSDFYDIYFRKDPNNPNKILPEVGFWIRLVPGVLPDLNGNTPHKDNPWLRIEGEQRVDTELPKVVDVNPALHTDENWPGGAETDVVVELVDPELTLKEIIAEKGLPGQLVKFELKEVAKTLMLGSTENRDSVLSRVRLHWEIEYFSSLGQYVNTAMGDLACNDKSVFGTDCIENTGNLFFMWDARSDKGRMVGTGVYIAKFKFKIFSDRDIVGKGDETFTFGIRRDEQAEH